MGLVFTAVSVWQQHAEACSYDSGELHVPIQTPQDGPLVGRLTCNGCTTDQLKFSTPAGEIAGRFITIEGVDDPTLFAFQPDEPFPLSDPDAPDDRLSVELNRESSYLVWVTAGDPSDPSILGSVSVTEQGAGETYSCKKYTEQDSCHSRPKIWSQTAHRATIGLNVEGSSCVYRATYTTEDQDVELVGLLEDVSSHVFDGEPDEVCYTLDCLATDGTETELAQGCWSTSDLALGVRDELFGTDKFQYCVAPPAAAEEAWCAFFQEGLAGQGCEDPPYFGFSDSCEAAVDRCGITTTNGGGASGRSPEQNDGTPEPEEEDGETTSVDDAEDDAGEQPTDTDSSSAGEDSGCSTGPSVPKTDALWPALLALCTAGVWARRRRTA